MSTDLIEGVNGVYFTRFFGGAERGVCYQIATKNDYGDYVWLQFTDAQMADIVSAYGASKKELERT